MAVWEIRKTLAQAHVYILVHCTHGFNRSGEPKLCLSFARPATLAALPQALYGV
jgi:hypothetical protein